MESEEDEEEVWLFWKDSNKEIRSKSIRELAQDAKEGQKEDQDVISYYRYTHCSWFLMSGGRSLSVMPVSAPQVPVESVCENVFGPTVFGHQQDLRPTGRGPDPALHVR